MKKKQFVTMMLALTVTVAVGIGATLALLSDTTSTLTNTFTVGSGIEIALDEEDVTNPPERTETGNAYLDLLPGKSVVKDPTTYVNKDSNDCYVFMKVTGIDALESAIIANSQESVFSVHGFDANNWIPVAVESGKKDGIYRYKSVVAKSGSDTKLPPLFKSVNCHMDADGTETGVIENVLVQSCAVQSGGGIETEEEALQAAIKEAGWE